MISILLAILICNLEAQVAKERLHSLSLKDCILRTMQHNLDLEIEGYNPKLREFDFIIASSPFDPSLSLSYAYGQTEQYQSSASSPKSVTSSAFEAKLQKKHLLGGTIGIAYTLDSTDQSGNNAARNPVWEQEFTLRVTQPLLRNLGIDTNLTQIRIAQHTLDSSYYNFYNKLLTVLYNVQKAYWDLMNTRENYELYRKSLGLAQNLYNITMERVKVGSLAVADSLDAERNVASKLDSLVNAEKQVENAEDSLKQLLYPLDLDYYKNVRIVPTEQPLFQEVELDLDKELQYALEHRPDLQQSKLSLQSSSLQVGYDKNQLLPSLDLVASMGLWGSGTSTGRSWNPIRERDYPRWQLGVTMEFPLGNRAANSRYQKSVAEREQLMAKHRQLENTVIVEIRQAMRDLKTSIRRVGTARKVRELAEKQLQNEENKFRAGLIALFQVQDTEQTLTAARISEVTALFDYQRARIALEKSKGLLLERLARDGIELKKFANANTTKGESR